MHSGTDATPWRFQVHGRLVDAATGVALDGRQAIIESGVRDPSSPLDHRGVGPVARSGADGAFASFFLTAGAAGEIAAPVAVFVFLKTGAGRWMPMRVPVAGLAVVDAATVRLDLAAVPVDLEAEAAHAAG